jgi:hypothetical protein
MITYRKIEKTIREKKWFVKKKNCPRVNEHLENINKNVAVNNIS